MCMAHSHTEACAAMWAKCTHTLSGSPPPWRDAPPAEWSESFVWRQAPSSGNTSSSTNHARRQQSKIHIHETYICLRFVTFSSWLRSFPKVRWTIPCFYGHQVSRNPRICGHKAQANPRSNPYFISHMLACVGITSCHRLAQVVGGWVQLVDKAPRPAAAPVPKEPTEKLMHEFQSLTAGDVEKIGMRLVSIPAQPHPDLALNELMAHFEFSFARELI